MELQCWKNFEEVVTVESKESDVVCCRVVLFGGQWVGTGLCLDPCVHSPRLDLRHTLVALLHRRELLPHTLPMATPPPSSSCALNSSIQSAVTTLQADFFSALQNGTSALVAFHSAWGTFSKLVTSCHSSLDDDTKDMIAFLQETVESVTSSLLDLPTGDDMVAELAQEVRATIDMHEHDLRDSDTSRPCKSAILYTFEYVKAYATQLREIYTSNYLPPGCVTTSAIPIHQQPREIP